MNFRLFFILIFISNGLSPVFAQVDESQVYKQYSTGKFIEIFKPYQSSEFAVGIQAKGRLANVITNFGQLGQFHVFTPSLNWPAFGEGQKDEQHYGWGVDVMMGYRGDVIESFQDPASNLISRDWQPANENLYSGNVTVSESDLTPLMATSDNKGTWPLNDFNEPFWPGWFRQDTTGRIFDNEFTSERDLFSVYTDEGNETQYGLRVEQTAYSFSRRYAEDLVIFRLDIQNTSMSDLDSLYPGMMIQFLIDFDNHDLINFIDSNNDGQRDFVYMWDTDQVPRNPWEKVGYIGLVMVNSPQDNGITNFHFFHDEFIPSKDQDFWMLLTSDTTDLPDTTKVKYFHGNDVHIDDVAYAPDLDPEGLGRGGEVTWVFSTGPVDLPAGDSMPMEFAIVLGENEEDLLKNLEWVWKLAENAWNGSNPPNTPSVQTFAADGRVTATWDAVAEASRDNITGENDFEGYKVYRSTNGGKTWGREITDFQGDFVGYVPIAQFDLENGVKGFDPISGSYLGDDTGIRHTFIDTTVTNGIEYWYTVTAYDRGDSLNKVESLESALGLTTNEINLAAAVPSAPPPNLSSGKVEGDHILAATDGIFYGEEVSIQVIDPSVMKSANYEITFNVDSVKTFTLRETTTDSIVLLNHPLSDESGDNLPVINGIRLKVKDTNTGTSFMGWTKVSGDTCTYDWYTEKRTGSNQEVEQEIVGPDDYKIVVVDGDDSTTVVLTDGVFEGKFHSYIKIPIKVFKITDPENPQDISEFTEVFDLRVQFPASMLLGPLGWDLIPGGAGYNPNTSVGDNTFWPDIIAMNTDTLGTSHLWLKTQNGPETAIPPSVGDEYTILVAKPFNENAVYQFSVQGSELKEAQSENLDQIRVVPNPFFVTSPFEDQIMFTHLPGPSEISIFNVAGDLVKTIYHIENSGSVYWDLKNDRGLAVAYGLYVYVVKTSNGQKRTGKFSIVR